MSPMIDAPNSVHFVFMLPSLASPLKLDSSSLVGKPTRPIGIPPGRLPMNPVEARAGASSEPGQEKLVTVIQRIWPVVNASQNATFCGIGAKVAGNGKNSPGGYPEDRSR